jgi:hypothetical protein
MVTVGRISPGICPTSLPKVSLVSEAARVLKGSGMVKQFAVGDHVRWNSEAGYVEGVIIKKHTRDVEYKGYVHHATESDPQYEIKSDKTDHIAMHKGGALTKL